MFKSSTSNSGGSFSSGMLEDLNKELWESFRTIVTVNVAPTWTVALPEEFQPTISKLKKEQLPDNPVELHAMFMKAWGESYRWKLEADLLKSVLLVRAASAAGIDGVFNWKKSEVTSFDVKAFKEKNPDLYNDCIPPKKTKLDVTPAEWKSYV